MALVFRLAVATIPAADLAIENTLSSTTNYQVVRSVVANNASHYGYVLAWTQTALQLPRFKQLGALNCTRDW